MFDKIRYLIKLENNISDAYSNEHTKIKINSDDDLPFKKKKKYAKFNNIYSCS